MIEQPHPQPYATQTGPYTDPAPGSPPPQPSHPGTNGFAIASLIFGILGGVLFATVFGIVGLVQTKRRNQSGKGLAITGLVLAGCWITVIVVAVAIAVTSDDTTSPSAAGTTVTNGAADTRDGVPLSKLVKGDCIGKLRGAGIGNTVQVVPCGKPHEGEVYATFTLASGAYPGEKAVEKQADKRCTEELDRYAPEAAGSVEVYYQYPVKDSWVLDRGVRCIASDPKGPRTGTLRD